MGGAMKMDRELKYVVAITLLVMLSSTVAYIGYRDARQCDIAKRHAFDSGVINGWLAMEEQRQGMINTNTQGLLDRAWQIYTNK